MAHGFLIHFQPDDVGVAVRDLSKGEQVEGVYMDNDSSITITLVSDVPLGHKVALRDMPEGHMCIEYGEIIGRITQPVKQGDHVHTHNIKSARWA